MIIHEVEQGTPEWVALRIGIPTASRFGCIVGSDGTPKAGRKKGSESETARSYMCELIAERLLGRELDDRQRVTAFMQRGTNLEDDAVKWYELEMDCTVRRIGFITVNLGVGHVGVSTDGLVGDDGVLEIKTPSMLNYVKSRMMGSIGAQYMPQCQGAIWLAERQWCHTVSYNEYATPAMFPVVRDDTYIANMRIAVAIFCEQLEAESTRLGVRDDWAEHVVIQPVDVSMEGIEQMRRNAMTPDEQADWDGLLAKAAYEGGTVR